MRRGCIADCLVDRVTVLPPSLDRKMVHVRVPDYFGRGARAARPHCAPQEARQEGARSDAGEAASANTMIVKRMMHSGHNHFHPEGEKKAKHYEALVSLASMPIIFGLAINPSRELSYKS